MKLSQTHENLLANIFKKEEDIRIQAIVKQDTSIKIEGMNMDLIKAMENDEFDNVTDCLCRLDAVNDVLHDDWMPDWEVITETFIGRTAYDENVDRNKLKLALYQNVADDYMPVLHEYSEEMVRVLGADRCPLLEAYEAIMSENLEARQHFVNRIKLLSIQREYELFDDLFK